MTGALAYLKYAHVGVVAAGLLSFWVPMLSPKGGPLHRQAGKLYSAFMLAAGSSGAVLAADILRKPGKLADGSFLLYALYVFFLVGRHAWRALDAKKGPAPLRTPLDLNLDRLGIAGGGAALGLGLWCRDSYLIVIGPLGALAALRHLRKLGRDWPKDGWLREHLGGMIATGVLGYSALIFFELSRYFPTSWGMAISLAVWLSPSALGIAASAVFLRRLKGGLAKTQARG